MYAYVSFIFESILDILKIVIPSFAVFSQLQNARASVRVSIRFVRSIFKKKFFWLIKMELLLTGLNFLLDRANRRRGTLYTKINLRTLPCPRKVLWKWPCCNVYSIFSFEQNFRFNSDGAQLKDLKTKVRDFLSMCRIKTPLITKYLEH